jgi:hypothetical protein
MEKVRIEPVKLDDHKQLIKRVLVQLNTAPRHLLVRSVMGLATTILELTTHETDMETMGVNVIHIIGEVLEANKNEPEYCPTFLSQKGEITT